MWLIQIFDLDVRRLGDVEEALRAIEGVGVASALRDEQPYVVADCPTDADAVRVQNVVSEIDPAAIVVHTAEGAGEAQDPVGL